MLGAKPHNRLVYQYEILRARLEIREHYLKTIVREVYENIGQVLSLVRVQLSLFEPGTELIGKEKVDSSGKLVGSAIRDLRSICQRLQPEMDILDGPGFNAVLITEIKNLYPESSCLIQPESIVLQTLENGSLLILFNTILEILAILKKDTDRRLLSMELSHKQQGVAFEFNYAGAPVQANVFQHHKNKTDLSILERVVLLKGVIKMKSEKFNIRKIKLVIPIN